MMIANRDSWEIMENNSILVGSGWVIRQTAKALLINANCAEGIGRLNFWIPKAFCRDHYNGSFTLRLPACLSLTLFAQERQGKNFVRTEEVNMTGEEFFAASAKFCEA